MLLGGSSFLGVDFFRWLRETAPPPPESHFTLRDFLMLWMSVLGKTVKAGETGITDMEEGHPREQRTVTRDPARATVAGKVWMGKENPAQPRDCRPRNEEW